MVDEHDVFSSPDTRCRLRSGVTVLSLEMRRPRISADVLQAFERAVDEAEQRSSALVITSSSEHFAFGADLDDALAAASQGRTELLDDALRNYQRVMLRLRHATVPVVAAIRGTAVSGGCEVLMHCARVVAHPDSTIGLREARAGVVPAGGGLKEFARRAAQSADPAQVISMAHDTIATATCSKSAADAQHLGFLMPLDLVDANPLELALVVAREMRATYFAPPMNPSFRVAGRAVFEKLRALQEEKLDRGEIMAHQLEVNTRIGAILCGSDSPGDVRTETELFELERRHFIALAQSPLTQARIAHLRSTGKPLFN